LSKHNFPPSLTKNPQEIGIPKDPLKILEWLQFVTLSLAWQGESEIKS